MRTKAVALCVLALAIGTPVSRTAAQSADLSRQTPKTQDFDKLHRSCQVWTDWQKTCSRTGSNHETVCKFDQHRPVQPSTPFCVVDSNQPLLRTSENLHDPDNIRSFFRFCRQRSAANSFDGTQTTTTELCLAFSKSRPFSGYVLSAIQHPWCLHWARRRSRVKDPYQCIRWKLPSWCDEARVLGSNKNRRFVPNSSIAVDSQHIPDRVPVVSVYCAREK